MPFTYNSSGYKIRRQLLRHNQTVFEYKLWTRIRSSQLGVRFHRQYSVGFYILDFYCPKVRLAIELDGAGHLDRKDYDMTRTDYLTSEDIKVMRFWNSEIEKDIDSVLNEIIRVIASRQ